MISVVLCMLLTALCACSAMGAFAGGERTAGAVLTLAAILLSLALYGSLRSWFDELDEARVQAAAPYVWSVPRECDCDRCFGGEDEH